ncbi:MAG: thermonuclease family protein, partial [Gammaproteobacteria bacterium]|nr:thermonuclease family protein [Gammaproteobacteria bacterium]
MRRALSKRAHLIGCALFVFLALLSPPRLFAQPCLPPVIDEYATVRYVHDGDTLHLTDGRKLRFIGINTPELARDDLPQEPYAVEARQYVRGLLPTGSRIGLVYGTEREDRHGRVLAHIVLADGSSLNRRMLEHGYAQYIAVPPNL